MAPTVNNKNTPELDLKKEFIERQLAIVGYLEEAERLPLYDILRDPLVVHSLEDYAAAYQEQERLRLIRTTMKSLQKIKRKNIDITPFLNKLTPSKTALSPQKKEYFIEAISSLRKERIVFDLLHSEEPISFTKERGVEDFKAHLRCINAIPRVSIQQPTFTRNMPVSSSHSQLLKKLERQDSPLNKDTPPMSIRPANEITGATIFKNGVMRPSISQRGIPTIPRTSSIKSSPPLAIGEAFNMIKRQQFNILKRSEEPDNSKRMKFNEFESEQQKKHDNNGNAPHKSKE